MSDIRKISRGQVWFLMDPDIPSVHHQDSVQGKNRPWLVVSNNNCNQNSKVYTAVPLTSQPKNDLPTHVEFVVGDQRNTILCEQLRSVPDRLFHNTGSNYKFTLSESIMEKVDEALATQLGLTLVMPNAERFWNSISSMIRVKVKESIKYCKMDAIDLQGVATILDKKTNDFIAEELIGKTTEPAKPEKPIESTQRNEPIKDFVPIRKGKRNVWNDTNKKQFLDDYYKYGVDYCMSAYCMERTSCSSTKTRFEKELKNGTISSRPD